MRRERMIKLADLVLETGAALEPGQRVVIWAEMAQREQALVFAERAYEKGASYVHIDWRDSRLARIRYDKAPGDLDYFPDFMVPYWDQLASERWASISFVGKEDPFLFESVDPEKQGRVARARAVKREDYHRRMLRKDFPWVVVPAPTPGWAAAVLDKEPSEETLDEFWDLLAPILKLDEPDPAQAWKNQARRLGDLSARFNDFQLDSLHFTGPGTDFTVGLSTQSRWIAGADKTSYGREVMVNLPTEEIFTTPDWRHTQGRVACTRPVEVLGTLVEGAWFQFKEGQVQDFGARSRGEALGAFLDQDPRARFLGEIALVDTTSPIFRSGRIFREILLDENAACHFALGSGYPDGLEGGTSLSATELLERGCNVSRVHLDFMIGSPDLSVEATDRLGRSLKILDHGRFVF